MYKCYNAFPLGVQILVFRQELSSRYLIALLWNDVQVESRNFYDYSQV